MNFAHSLAVAPLVAFALLFGQAAQAPQDNPVPAPAPQGSPVTHNGLDYIGRGWNLLTPNAARKERLINDESNGSKPRDSAIGSLPAIYTYVPEPKQETSDYEADNFSSLNRQRSVEASAEGSYLAVSASGQMKFSAKAQNESEYHLKLKSIFALAGKLQFEDSGENEVQTTIQKSLKPSVKAMLNDNTVSPEILFQKYGTHILTKVYLGGKVEFYYESSNVKNVTSEEFSAAAELKYDGVAAKGNASVKVSSSTAGETKDVEIRSETSATGGDTSSIDPDAQLKDTKEWRSSVTKMPTFVGYPTDGLIPLWELCSDQKRSDQIETAYKRQRAINKLKNLVFFTKTIVGYAAPSGDRMVSGTYTTADIPRREASKSYKILSGGARMLEPSDQNRGGATFFLMRDSYPTGLNQWTARFQFRQPDLPEPTSPKLQISVVALYDPENDWDVREFTRTKDYKSEPYPFEQSEQTFGTVMVGTLGEAIGYELTGGGVQLEYASGKAQLGHVVQSAGPYSPWLYTNGKFDPNSTIGKERAKDPTANPYINSGWQWSIQSIALRGLNTAGGAGFAGLFLGQKYFEDAPLHSKTSLIAKCIGIKPAPGLGIKLALEIWGEKGDVGNWPKATVRAPVGEFVLIGGGAGGGGSITPGILGTNGNYLFASYPGLEKDGSIAWYGQAGIYRLEYGGLGAWDLGSQAGFTVYGIGLRVK